MKACRTLLIFWGVVLFSLAIWNTIPREPIEQQLERVDIQQTVGAERSSKWREVRQEYIHFHPVCEICGSKTDLNVHHYESFKDHPEKELDMDNLVTLCRYHHFWMGHNGNWKTTNNKLNEKIHGMPTPSK